jgi:hypothetical protein
LLPLLELLYGASRRSPNQIYMLLIILLILSQDASFNANVHKLMLPGVPWYRERLLPRISLGSLMVVILIRTVKYNLSKLRVSAAATETNRPKLSQRGCLSRVFMSGIVKQQECPGTKVKDLDAGV